MKVTSADFVLSAVSVNGRPPGGLPEVAFLGPSNVGKSSLLNWLVSRTGLARVSKTPGRTQEINFFRINGVLHFVDLPGYGFAKVPRAVQDKFLRLVEEYLAQSPDLVLLVLLQDCRRTPSENDVEMRKWLVANGVPHLVVLTKSDKLSRGAVAAQAQAVRKGLGGPAKEELAIIPVSVTSGAGKGELWQAIDARLVQG